MTKTNDKPEEEKKKCQENNTRIYAATEKDWEDFFAAQEDLDYLFDR
jgi:hypothetical protein